MDPNEYGEEDGANVDLDSQRKGKCAVIKTSTRQTYFLPVIGLVDAETLKPGDLVGVNKDSYLILETLPAEYDSRVKAMEVDERPTEQYSDIGGLDKQIQELIEAVVLPVTHKERFENLGKLLCPHFIFQWEHWILFVCLIGPEMCNMDGKTEKVKCFL